MTQPSNEQNKKTTGYLFIAAGLLACASRFIGEAKWNTLGIVKLSIGIVLIAYGLWTVLKKTKK